MFCRIAAGPAPLPGLVRRLAAPKLPAKLFAAHQKFGDGEDGHKREHELQQHPLHRMVSILCSHQIPRMAVSSTVWMQKMKSERRPTHSMAWEMGPSTRRCHFKRAG